MTEETCPECGASSAVEISRAEEPDAQGYIAVLLECPECDTAWDTWVKAS